MPLPQNGPGPSAMNYGDSNDLVNGMFGLDPGGRFDQNQYDPNAVQAAAQVQSAQGYDPTAQAQTRAAQTALLGTLQQQAAGQGPSIADTQARTAQDANAAAAGTFIAQNRGLSPGAAATLGAQQLAQSQAAVNQQHQAGKIAEQLGAESQIGQVAGQARGQDLNAGQLTQQNNQFNAQAFNTQLGADAQSQNAMKAAQNAQIAAAETARRAQQAQLLKGIASGASSVAGAFGI